jgi:citrate lyase alpha subunit
MGLKLFDILSVDVLFTHAGISAGQQRQDLEQDLNAIDGETILSRSKFTHL